MPSHRSSTSRMRSATESFEISTSSAATVLTPPPPATSRRLR
jgi:hypothetical protein